MPFLPFAHPFVTDVSGLFLGRMRGRWPVIKFGSFRDRRLCGPLSQCLQASDCGQPVERMNRTIKEATVKLYHFDSNDQLRTDLAGFMAAYNFASRLKTLCGRTPYEYICKTWPSEPD